MMYVGLDVSRKSCYATVMDERGNVMQQTKFMNSIEELDKFLESLEEASVVLESSYSWQHLYEHIESKGFDVKLANPVKTKAIADVRIKTDKLDSETLAHLLRSNLIAESYVPTNDIRELREIVRHRAFLVKIRVAVKNHIHAMLARQGISYSYTDLFGKAGIEFLRNVLLKEKDRYELNNYLELLIHLNMLVEKVSERIDNLAKEVQEVKLLTTIPGIGVYSALLLMSEIGDIKRFPSAKKLCSYAGLVPSTYQSGNVEYHGRITKRGSTWMRWVLIQASHIAVREANMFNSFYNRINKRKGGKMAIVATARKMLTVIYHMLLKNKEFMLQGNGTLN